MRRHSGGASLAVSVPAFAGMEAVEAIGNGGFATVYRARETAFDRDVAVKVLTVTSVSDDTKRRFERECKAIGSLSSHPHIVTVFGTGATADGRPYIVMELMTGGSLAQRIVAEGPMPPRDAVAMGIELASAVQAAHELGILHRDIKPDNILISRYGQAQLADFGISSIPGGFETRSGHVTASMGYAAPEILDGKKATPASDVYSLAATIATLITGEQLFAREDDESLYALIARIVREPPPSLIKHGASPKLQAVFDRALAKTPDQRFGSAEEFGSALAAVPDLRRSRAPKSRKAPALPRQRADKSLDALAPEAHVQADDVTDIAERTVVRSRRPPIDPPGDEPISAAWWRRRSTVAAAVAAVLVVAGATAFATHSSKHSPRLAAATVKPLPKPAVKSACIGFSCSFRYVGTSLPTGSSLRWQFGDGESSAASALVARHTYRATGTHLNTHATVTVVQGTRHSALTQIPVSLASWNRSAHLTGIGRGSRQLTLTVKSTNPSCVAGPVTLQRANGSRWVNVKRVSVSSSGLRTLTAPGYDSYQVVPAARNVSNGKCISRPSGSAILRPPAHGRSHATAGAPSGAATVTTPSQPAVQSSPTHRRPVTPYTPAPPN